MLTSWILLLGLAALGAGALPTSNDQPSDGEVVNFTTPSALPKESLSSPSGDFCPIIWDASISDCVKVEKLMGWLGETRYGGEFCRNPEEIVAKARQCCMQKDRRNCSKAGALRRFIARRMPKVPDVVDS